MSKTNEWGFEASIEETLTSKGCYAKGLAGDYNKDLALDTSTLFSFLQSTQKSSLDLDKMPKIKDINWIKIILEIITVVYYTTNNIPTAPLLKSKRNSVGFLF